MQSIRGVTREKLARSADLNLSSDPGLTFTQAVIPFATGPDTACSRPSSLFRCGYRRLCAYAECLDIDGHPLSAGRCGGNQRGGAVVAGTARNAGRDAGPGECG